MEDTSGPVIQTPFGESPFGELISHWLDEGDRLSASAADIPAPAPATEGRVRDFIHRLQPMMARHRLFVFAGIGLLPLVLILSTKRGAPPVSAATVALALPVAAPATSEARPAPGAPVHPALAPMPTPTPSSAATTTPAAATLASAGSPEWRAAPPRHHHHHHHHHHAESAPAKAIASAGRATRR